MYHTFLADRHYFVNLRKSIAVIQQAIRVWNAQQFYRTRTVCNKKCILRATTVYTESGTPKNKGSVAYKEGGGDDLETAAAITIQDYWKGYIFSKSFRSQHIAATKIQSHYRGWLMRKSFACKVPKHKGSIAYEEDEGDDLETAAITIQNYWKGYIFSKSFRNQHIAATKIQSHYRGWLMRKSFASKKQAIKTIQKSFRCSRTRRDFQIQKMKSAVILQSHLRGWMARREAYRERDLFIKTQVSFF